MKKIIFFLTAIITLAFSACTNDDILISSSTMLRVNPQNVMSNFKEMNAGDLDVFSKNYKLRVRVLIYNDAGALVKDDTQFLNNYASIMSTTLDIPNGNYIALAITDIVRLSGDEISSEIWALSGENTLSGAKLTRAHIVAFNKDDILGIGSTRLSIGQDMPNEYSLNVGPAGALIVNVVMNLHTYNDVEKYTLFSDRTSDYAIFKNDGTYEPSVRTEEGRIFKQSEIGTDQTGNNIYEYTFILPIRNVKMHYEAYLNDGKRVTLSEEAVVNYNVGDQYLFMLDLNDEEEDGNITFQYELVNGSRGTKSLTSHSFEKTRESLNSHFSENQNSVLVSSLMSTSIK